MLCHQCLTFFETERKKRLSYKWPSRKVSASDWARVQVTLHARLEDLVDASSDGCELCKLLLGAFCANCPENDASRIRGRISLKTNPGGRSKEHPALPCHLIAIANIIGSDENSKLKVRMRRKILS